METKKDDYWLNLVSVYFVVIVASLIYAFLFKIGWNISLPIITNYYVPTIDFGVSAGIVVMLNCIGWCFKLNAR